MNSSERPRRERVTRNRRGMASPPADPKKQTPPPVKPNAIWLVGQRLSEEEILRTFKGCVTDRTLGAVHRIQAKPPRIKIPKHLVEKLWNLTGGWKEELDKKFSSYLSSQEASLFHAGLIRIVRLGDLEVILYHYSEYSYKNKGTPSVMLHYRGWIIQFQNWPWTDAAKSNLSVAFSKMAKPISYEHGLRLGIAKSS